MNGDGVADFSVSAPGDDGPNGTNAGRVYMYNGVNASLIYSVGGDAPNEMYGAVVENVGDKYYTVYLGTDNGKDFGEKNNANGESEFTASHFVMQDSWQN